MFLFPTIGLEIGISINVSNLDCNTKLISFFFISISDCIINFLSATFIIGLLSWRNVGMS